MNDGWAHGVQDMDASTDTANLRNYMVRQVDSNLAVKAHQCKVVDVRVLSDVLVSRSVRVPWTNDIAIANIKLCFFKDGRDARERPITLAKPVQGEDVAALISFPYPIPNLDFTFEPLVKRLFEVVNQYLS